MRRISVVLSLITFVVAGVLSFNGPLALFAAANPIDEFCASPTAQADAQARQECDELKILQTSNAQIKGEKDSIQAEINAIDVQINLALQNIKVQNIIIDKLSKDIDGKVKTVNALQSRIEDQTKSMSALLVKLNDRDDASILQIMLGSRQFSDFYTEVDQYMALNKQLTALIEDVRSSKQQTETEKQTLEERKDRETDAKLAIEAQKKLIDRKRSDKAALLKLASSKLDVAQKLLASQQQQVAQIRARLFKFQDGEGIPFGDAYDIAVKASAKTGGVRPALILAVLTQESSRDENGLLGTSIGSCYVKNLTTGDGIGKNSGRAFERVMYSDTTTKRPSDTAAFQVITTRLGRDWSTTPVSCPPDPKGNGKYYSGRGFGGGMGPTQFIPSTWELIKNKIGAAVGTDPDQLNPWSYTDAIYATAVLLRDAGAKSSSALSTERNAACIYYSGSKCIVGRKPPNAFYGDQVMAKAADFQDDIDAITGR